MSNLKVQLQLQGVPRYSCTQLSAGRNCRQGLDSFPCFHDNIIITNLVKVLMLQVITAKLKLEANPEQKELLREVSLAYRDALNYTSQLNFKDKKSANGTKIQKLVYQEIRSQFRLPSQMACNGAIR